MYPERDKPSSRNTIGHFTILRNVTKPLHESEVRGDLEMIETQN